MLIAIYTRAKRSLCALSRESAVRAVLCAAAAAMPLVIWRGTYYYMAVKEFLAHTAALLCIVMLFWPRGGENLSGRVFAVVKKSKCARAAALYGLVAALSLFFSPHSGFAVRNNLPLLVSGLVFFYSAAVVFDRCSVRGLCGIWLASASVFSLYSLLCRAGIISAPRLIGNPNLEAGYLVLSFPVALSLMLREYDAGREPPPDAEIPESGRCFSCVRGSKRKTALYAGQSVLLLAAAAATLSRGATIGIAASVFALTVLFRKAKPGSALAENARLVFICLVFMAVFGGVMIAPQIKTRDIERMGTAGVRAGIWKNALRIGAERPVLGAGYGTFKLAYARYGTSLPSQADTPRHAHCEPLQVFSETGVPGLSAFVLFVFFFFKEASGVVKSIRDGPAAYVSAGFTAGAAGLLAHNLVSVNLRYPVSLILMFTAMGAVVSLGSGNAPAGAGGRGKIVNARNCRAAAAAALVLLSTWAWKEAALDGFRSQYKLAMGMRYLATERLGGERFERAGEQFDAAFALNPASYRAKWYRASAYERQSRYHEAICSLREARSIFPDSWGIHRGLGMVYMKIGDGPSARKHFLRAIELAPASPFSYAGLARVYSEAGEYDAALAAYKEAIERGMLEAGVFYSAAEIHFRREEFIEAASYYSLALLASPGNEHILRKIRKAEEMIEARQGG